MTGPTLFLTRDAEGCARWAEELRTRGLRSIALPCLDIEPIDDQARVTELSEALGRARWLALTSARGVDAVAALCDRPVDARLRIAAVGPATARRCRERFGRVDLEAPGGTAASLAVSLAETLLETDEAWGPVLAAVADRARTDLEDALRAAGLEVERVEVYRTVPASGPAEETERPPLAELLRRRGLEASVDAILVASPSALEGLLNQARVRGSRPIATLGPTTSAAVRARGLAVVAEASRPTLESLVDALMSNRIAQKPIPA